MKITGNFLISNITWFFFTVFVLQKSYTHDNLHFCFSGCLNVLFEPFPFKQQLFPAHSLTNHWVNLPFPSLLPPSHPVYIMALFFFISPFALCLWAVTYEAASKRLFSPCSPLLLLILSLLAESMTSTLYLVTLPCTFVLREISNQIYLGLSLRFPIIQWFSSRAAHESRVPWGLTRSQCLGCSCHTVNTPWLDMKCLAHTVFPWVTSEKCSLLFPLLVH